jgi:hypothetical protein
MPPATITIARKNGFPNASPTTSFIANPIKIAGITAMKSL